MLDALLRTSLGGLFVFALVWGICRVFPKIHPAVRFWLWWLVCARLVFGLFLAGLSVPLPVLKPTQRLSRPAAVAVSSEPTPNPPLPLPWPPGEGGHEGNEGPGGFRTGGLKPGNFRVSYLLVLWLTGAFFALGRDVFRALGLKKKLGKLTPDAGGVAISNEVSSPLVVGLWRPVIVLPPGLGESERAMALAHERAHVRRGDLWLGLVLTLARALFWFHPVAHWAACEAELAREEACDRAARQSGARPAAYGRFLLRVSGESSASAPAPAPVGGLGMAAFEHVALKRRLLALSATPSEASRRALVGVGLAGVVLLTPWALVPRRAGAEAARDEPGTQRLGVRGLRWRVLALGEGYSDAFSLSDSGQVAGVAGGKSGQGRAFLYDSRAGHYSDLGTFGRSRSVARGVNDAGQVALAAFNRANRPRGWVVGATKAALDGLPGFPYAQPLGLSDAGVVVGSARKSAVPGDAVGARAFAAQGTRMRDLGTLGGPYSHAFAVNLRGQIVGKADLAPRPKWVSSALGLPSVATHAFLWEAGKMRDLGTLGGDTSRAHAISESGVVVGQAQTASGESHAFVWESDELRDLGTLPGGSESAAHGIDASGRVVGSALDASGTRRAVVWEQGIIRDLNSTLAPGSGWHLEVVRAVNGRGQLVGQGIFHGQRRAFLLDPLK